MRKMCGRDEGGEFDFAVRLAGCYGIGRLAGHGHEE
jgi:hypothetical protein